MDISEFLKKRADEVMVRDVTVLRQGDTLANAAYTFLHQQISGAPVVDADGACVGVLSVSDVLGAEDKDAERRAEIAEAFFSRSELVLPLTVYEDDLAAVRDKSVPASEQSIENFMATNIVSVKIDAPIEEVARNFIDAGIHRVLVVEQDGKLAGLITTTDIIAALLQTPSDEAIH